MTPAKLTCHDEQRRHAVRQHSNGLDYLEVSQDQRSLCVHFIGPLPTNLQAQNLVIKGGRRIRHIQVVGIRIEEQADPTLDSCLRVHVDKIGDFSPYTLCLVDLDEQGRPSDRPHPKFDPRYAQLTFSFKAGCPSDLDCQSAPPRTEQLPIDIPEINYLAKDYGSFRQLILDRLSLLVPDWQERHVPDLGITLVELLAYVGDHLSYYQDAVATEAYLDTARQRISLRRHTRLIDYPMHEGCNARTWVHIALRGDAHYELPLVDTAFITPYPTAPARGTILTGDHLRSLPSDAYEVFEPVPGQSLTLHAAHNEIWLYTWGDRQCCLPAGTTTATLVDAWDAEATADDTAKTKPQQKEACDSSDPAPPAATGRQLKLKPGDMLLLEEVLGPTTGNPADADPAHRHVVKLTQVTPIDDPLFLDEHGRPIPLLEVEWAIADALPFSLCLSTIGPAPTCELINQISVARGNLVLADHGRTLRQEPLGEVPEKEVRSRCIAEDQAIPAEIIPGKFNPHLRYQPLTFSQPLLPLPASQLLTQDPRQALPHLTVVSDQGEWVPQRDLLASQPLDRHFVAEVDNDGRAHLRFGDGESGLRPAAHTQFTATYRIGNGAAGNIGAETLAFVVLPNLEDGLRLEPRNPFPAMGGVNPEPMDEVKLFAPGTFRQELQRAITPQDYADLVMRDFADQVQRAAAALQWTGSWPEIWVAVDPIGTTELSDELQSQILQRLHLYRRMGHDVVVQAAELVPLHIEMTICVHPDFIRGHVKAAVLSAFSTGFTAQGEKGFFHPDQLTFGEGIALSRLVATAQAIAGVESVSVTRLERLYAGPNGEREQGLLPLGPLEVAQLDNDPNFPDNGKLILQMRGGR